MAGSKQRAVALALGVSGGIMFSGHASAAWYVGLGGGLSLLSPNTEGSAYVLNEELSEAAAAYIGLDINDWLSAEAAYTDLGAALLSGEEEISYTSASVGGIAYFYGNRGMDARQSGLSAYFRLGANSITNEANIPLNEADSTALWIGAGVQYPLGERFGVRAEVASFDGDAQVALASIFWRSRSDGDRFGRGGLSTGSQRTTPSVQRPNDDYQNGGINEQVEPYGTNENYPSNNGAYDTQPTFPEPTGNTAYSMGTSSNCAAPSRGEPADPAGCALFTGLVEGVEFEQGTATLASGSEYLLESLALSLNNYPMLVIELQVHTESYGQPRLDMQVARGRVVTVARFLVSQGVDVQRLRGRAYGSARPNFDNNSPEGRRMNNRVELRVL